MEAPKFVMCPECDERYDDSRKRRIIDSCGHPRCFSCLFVDRPCPLCEQLLSGRPKSFFGSRDSLLCTDDEHGNYGHVCTKEQYLRTLYSYDPGSKENCARNVRAVDMRRRSLDSHMLRCQRKLNLGLHSCSSSVMGNVSPKLHHPVNVSRQLSHEYGANLKRNSLPSVSFKDESENQQLISQSLEPCNDFSGSELSSCSLSPGPSSSMMKFFDEVIENDESENSGFDNNGTCSYFNEASRRASSGYWSENSNEREAGNNIP